MKFQSKKDRFDRSYLSYNDLMYGLWEMDDGEEIAFNRAYKAIWARNPQTGEVRRTPDKHYSEIRSSKRISENWFWDDGCSPLLGDRKAWPKAEKMLFRFLTGRSVNTQFLRSVQKDIDDLV